jgi:hypothetical protein
MDNRNRIIVGADRNLPNRNADAQIAVELVGRLKWAYQLKLCTLGGDKGECDGVFAHWLLEQNVLPHVPNMDSRGRNEKGFSHRVVQVRRTQRPVCLSARQDSSVYRGIQQYSKQHTYRAGLKDCRSCPVKDQCTRGSYRSLSYHVYESSIDVARKLTKTRG